MELRPPMENDANAATAEELEQQAADVYVERALHGPVFRMAYEHVHTYCELFYLRSGTCTYTVNKAQWHLEAGDIFIVAPGAPHSTRYEGKTSCERIIVFCMPEVILPLLPESAEELRGVLARSGKVILNADSRRAVDAMISNMLLENDLPQRFSEDILKLESLHLLLLLLRDGIFSYETMSDKEGYSADIERALKYIALNYPQPLTLEGGCRPLQPKCDLLFAQVQAYHGANLQGAPELHPAASGQADALHDRQHRDEDRHAVRFWQQ